MTGAVKKFSQLVQLEKITCASSWEALTVAEFGNMLFPAVGALISVALIFCSLMAGE